MANRPALSDLLLISGFAVIALLVAFVFSPHIGFYSAAQPLGPFSVSPFYFIFMAGALGALTAMVGKYHDGKLLTLLVPFFVLLVVIYVVPNILDSNYATNYYDASGHLSRGLYVAATGHSNSSVDTYFDVQPAFFWLTAEFLTVVGGSTSSETSAISFEILKWFPIFAILTSLPILLALYKRLLRSSGLVSAALVLQFGVNLSRFHYSAEIVADILFWVVLLIILIAKDSGSSKVLFTAVLPCVALVFMHQGVTFITVLTLIALAVYPIIFRLIRMPGFGIVRRDFALLVIVILAWFTYLAFVTVYTFANFLSALKSVVATLFGEGLTLVFQGSIRPNAGWHQVVVGEEIFLAGLIIISLVGSLSISARSRSEQDKFVFSSILITSVFFGGIALELGGAGYIARWPEIMMPFIAYTFIRIAQVVNRKMNVPHLAHPFVVGLALFLLLAPSTTLYFSGRNFQSLTYGEIYSKSFTTSFTPSNVVGLYPGTSVIQLYPFVQTIQEKQTIQTGQVLLFNIHDYIQAAYYLTGNATSVRNIADSAISSSNQVYENPDASILVYR